MLRSDSWSFPTHRLTTFVDILLQCFRFALFLSKPFVRLFLRLRLCAVMRSTVRTKSHNVYALFLDHFVADIAMTRKPSYSLFPSPPQSFFDDPLAAAHRPWSPIRSAFLPSSQPLHVPPPSREASFEHTRDFLVPCDMDHSTFSTASTVASDPSTSFAKPLHSAPLPLPEDRISRSKIVYFHGGIGGRGNYRKVIRENKHAPLAHAENAECINPPFRRSSPTRILSLLFGGRMWSRRAESPESDLGSSESSGDTLPLGAAEAMRRKMLGHTGKGRRSEGCERS